MFLSSFVFGQTVSLDVENKSIRDLFAQVEQQSNLKFSFNTKLINRDSLVFYKCSNKAINRVVTDLFYNKILAKYIGQHIVLIENTKQINRNQKVKKQSKNLSFSGIILDARTNKAINEANIYNVYTRETVLTDSLGKFEIINILNENIKTYNFAKRGYQDTIISVDIKTQKEILVKLSPVIQEIAKLNPKQIEEIPIEQKSQFLMGFVPKEALISTENLHKVLEKRIAQMSFLPTIGTNWISSGVVSSYFSINVLAGYNGGVNGLEIGGLLNIIDNSVNGFQVAGLSNIVAGKTEGFQVAGLLNKNRESVDGMQVAGLSNIVTGKTTGFQVAGLLNKNRGSVEGMQVAGLSNIVTGKTIGFQVAGLQNINKEKVVGVQIAGISNYLLDTLKGFQISTIFNKAKQNNGLQIGLINVSDSSRGVAIGLFNYVKNGYNSIEFSANEIFYTNIKYKMGAKHFYNIYSFGIRPNDLEFFGAGFGFGSNITVYKKISLSIEATATYVQESKVQNPNANISNRLDFILDYKISKNINLLLGPSLNVFVSQTNNKETSDFTSNIISNSFYSNTNENTILQMWIGGSFGLSYSF